MNDNIKVSIVCCVYNHEKYLRDALDNFVSQETNFPFEVIVHDDASTDGSKKIIEEYEKKYPSIIKPIYQIENQYSKGINIVNAFVFPKIRGEYVAFCEGDDYWCDNHKIQKQVDFLMSNPEYSGCAHPNIRLYVKTGRKEVTFRRKRGDNKDLNITDLLAWNCFQNVSLMCKTSFFLNQPAWIEKFGIGDYPLCIWLFINGKIHIMDDVMSVYRRGIEGSWSDRVLGDIDKRCEHEEDIVLMWKRFIKYFSPQDKYLILNHIKKLYYDIDKQRGDYRYLKQQKYSIYEVENNNVIETIRSMINVYKKCYVPKLCNSFNGRINIDK